MSDKPRLYQVVARAIAERIAAGEFPHGSRLPGERELAERFGVSRVTIREAEIALETQGHVVVRTGSGVHVSRRPPADPAALPDVSAFELTTARSVIEAETAALAAVNVTPSQLDELGGLIDRMVRADAEGDGGGEEVDRLFHLRIAEATGNPALAHTVAQLWRMRSELPRVRDVYAPVCVAHARTRADEHRTILEALKRHDPHAARVAMRDHFRRLFDTMLTAREAAAIAEVKQRMSEDRERFLQTTSL